MFTPKTKLIEKISSEKQGVIRQLENIFDKRTRVYIDYANVRPWSNKLGWHIDLARLKAFLGSFDTIEVINFYNGYLAGNERSEREKAVAENCKYILRTKPVKKMYFSIDASSISPDSTALLDQFIRRALIKKYDIETIEYLNNRFGDMNKKGEFFIEDMKCNFDVEIGVDMLLDCERNSAENFVLWSGDSDFADPIKKLLSAGRKVFLFATVRKISKELSALKNDGLVIFEIQKINKFICWNDEIESIDSIKSKEDLSKEALKH